MPSPESPAILTTTRSTVLTPAGAAFSSVSVAIDFLSDRLRRHTPVEGEAHGWIDQQALIRRWIMADSARRFTPGSVGRYLPDGSFDPLHGGENGRLEIGGERNEGVERAQPLDGRV